MDIFICFRFVPLYWNNCAHLYTSKHWGHYYMHDNLSCLTLIKMEWGGGGGQVKNYFRPTDFRTIIKFVFETH